ncbi:hypothetical protein [Rhizocola hellebori]|nr:hypothetical protein [Rhizocola hellebori]
MSSDRAEALMAEDPFGAALLAAHIPPGEACVTATRWLTAAAYVTSDVAGAGTDRVFPEAADEFQVPNWELMEAVVNRVLDDEIAPPDAIAEILETGIDETDLLDILLAGMDACLQVYGIYASFDDESDDTEERPEHEVTAEFVTKVRAEAASRH